MNLKHTLPALLGLFVAACSTAPSSSSTPTSPAISLPGSYAGYSPIIYDGYELTSRYISMRDGTRIAIDVFRPTRNGALEEGPLPVLWMHTPYNRRHFRGDALTAATYPGKALSLLPYGYVVAVADFRGLYASFGGNAGFNRGEWQDEARMDAYDITEWLAAQPWSTGNVGMWGCSATGGSQMQALTTAPPSLKAVFPMSCEWDVYPFANFGGMSPPDGVPTRAPRGGSLEERDKLAVPVDADTDRTLLDAAIAEHADNIETAGYTPYRDSTAQNFDEQWWLKSSPASYEAEIEASGVAIYSAVNLDETGAGYGPAFTFNNLSNPRKFIIGPGKHCDWSSVQKDTGFDILVEELRFFDHWLKGVSNGVMDEAPVTYFTYNSEQTDIGVPGWRSAPAWPLPQQVLTPFYLTEGALTRSMPDAASHEVNVDYEITQENFWARGLQFLSPPLARDMQITGHPVLRLWLSSTATDADVIARIDDLAPDGTSTYHTVEGRLRASMRARTTPPYNNLGLPYHPFTAKSKQPLIPGEPVLLEFDFYMMSNLFKQGHQIRLTLNFADERATPRLSPAPRVTIHSGADMSSRLILPVIPAKQTIAQAGCDRACIVNTTQTYVDAMVSGEAYFQNHATLPRSTFNGVDAPPLPDNWPRIASAGTYRQTFVDDDLNSAVLFGAFTEQTPDGEAPLLMALRFEMEGEQITAIEHLLSRPDWRNRLINRHTLQEPNLSFDTLLSPEQRTPRASLIDAAHAYFDGIAQSSDEGVPMHPQCLRQENGVTLLKNPHPQTQPCPIGFHRFNYITAVRDRRVAVVDEARGLVLMYAMFDIPGNVPVQPGPWIGAQGGVDSRKIPRSLYIAELFKVEAGQIRDIAAIMFNLDLNAESGWQ